MNEIVIVVVAIVALIVGVIIYGVLSTTAGYEEDVNKNYIPDRFERMLGMDPRKKEDADSWSSRSAQRLSSSKECLDNLTFNTRFTR